MATFYVTNGLYPENPQLFTINIQQIVKIKGEPQTDFYRDHTGDSFWEISVYTTGKDAYGDSVPPVFADVFGSESSLNDVVAAKIEELCSKIDWSSSGDYTEQEDTSPPALVSQFPEPGGTEVPLGSAIRIEVKENLPSDGMDISTMYLKVKGVSVVPSVEGNPYGYVISYTPAVV